MREFAQITDRRNIDNNFAPRVFETKRGWRVSLDAGDGVLVSKDVGKFVSLCIRARERFITNPDGEGLVASVCSNVNCHKLVGGMLGLLGFKDVLSDTDDNLKSTIKEFIINNELQHTSGEESVDYIMRHRGTMPMAVHFVKYDSTQQDDFRVIHSFIILGVDDIGRIICLNKEGAPNPERFFVRSMSEIESIYYSKEMKLQYVTHGVDEYVLPVQLAAE